MSGSNNNSNNIQNLATMIALYHFEAESEPEISLKQNDQIEMLDMDPALNGWAYARRKRDGAEGYVPISYLGTINTNNNRSHKSSKSGNVNQSRSSSPNPNKSRFDNDIKNSGFNRNKGYGNNPNQRNYNQQNNNPQSNNYGNKGHNKGGYGQNQGDDGNDGHSVNTNNNNNGANQQHQHHHHNPHQQQSSHSNQSNQSNQGNQQNNKGNSNNNNNSDGNDGRQIICSFHRDFIPEMPDLYKYFGEFGKVTNKIEIEYDTKKVPLAKIRFQTSQCVDKVVNKGNRQQIPSGQQNGTIHIRVYRSMQDYIQNTQRSNRGPYNKHKSNRRGGF